MAVTVTTKLAGSSRFIATVAATADADVTTGNIPHGLGATPLSVTITPLQVLVLAAGANWAITALNGTNVVAGKLNTLNSGIPGDQIQIEVALPHSLVK